MNERSPNWFDDMYSGFYYDDKELETFGCGDFCEDFKEEIYPKVDTPYKNKLDDEMILVKEEINVRGERRNIFIVENVKTKENYYVNLDHFRSRFVEISVKEMLKG